MVFKQAIETHLIDDTSQPARAVNRIAADHRPRRWGNRLRRVLGALFMFYRVPVAIDIEGGYVRRCGRPWRVVGAAIGDTGSVKQVLRSAEGVAPRGWCVGPRDRGTLSG